MRDVPRPLALCAICFVLLPAAAHGQAGAQLDPDSPAGVEYQLPLEQAREKANRGGGDGTGGRGEGLASLFGAGVVPIRDRAGMPRRGNGGGAEADSISEPGSGNPRAGRRGDADLDPVGQTGLIYPEEDEGSAALRIAGIALAVLLVGGLLGLALRRGLRQSAE